jgi:hypothetical protein
MDVKVSVAAGRWDQLGIDEGEAEMMTARSGERKSTRHGCASE